MASDRKLPRWASAIVALIYPIRRIRPQFRPRGFADLSTQVEKLSVVLRVSRVSRRLRKHFVVGHFPFAFSPSVFRTPTAYPASGASAKRLQCPIASRAAKQLLT
jgi:hypothetical protein